MKTPTRFALASLCAMGMAQALAHAQSALVPQTSPAATAEQSMVLPALPTSRVSGSVESSFGYNDNLLLSHAEEERSAFARGRAELFALNMPPGPFDYAFFGGASGTRYFSGKAVNHEARAWLNVEPGYRISEQLKLSLPVAGFYRDEVLDVSNTEVERLVAAWKVWGANVAPTLRWTFHPAWWVEASATGERSVYDDHSEDNRRGAGEVKLNWQPFSRVEVRLSGSESWRNFKSRAQYNAAGREQEGTRLKVARRDGELRFDISWDEAKRWKTSTRASLMDYRDNGSGFFNYRGKGISQEIEFETDQWLLRLEGTANRFDFAVQTAGIGLEPPPVVKDHYFAEVRVERTLSRRWTAFGGYTWERRRSNEQIASYVVNEGLLGLRWSWVK